MSKKTIKLTENQLTEATKESLKNVLNEDFSIDLNSPEEAEPILEMAHINSNETGNRSIFPFNSWEVKIWSDDHNPPHFHIKREGWNVSYDIETGERIEVLSKGDKSNIFDYMESNVKRWLDSPSSILPQITNRENARAQWIQLHS